MCKWWLWPWQKTKQWYWPQLRHSSAYVMVTQQYSLQCTYAAVLQDRPQLNTCMLPLVSLPSSAEKAIVPDMEILPTMQQCSSCQNFVALGAVSTYPVAMAMPRMTNGRSMPNMPTIAIGSWSQHSALYLQSMLLSSSSHSCWYAWMVQLSLDFKVQRKTGTLRGAKPPADSALVMKNLQAKSLCSSLFRCNA